MLLDVINDISNFIDNINGNILSPIMMILILGTGILLTIRLNFLQITYFPHSINETIVPSVKNIFEKKIKQKKVCYPNFKLSLPQLQVL